MADFKRCVELEQAMDAYISGGRTEITPLRDVILKLALEDRELIIGGHYVEEADDMLAALDRLNEKMYLTVFTSEKALNYAHLDGAVRNISAILDIANEEDDEPLDGIVLNSRQESVILSRELIGEILEAWEEELAFRLASPPMLVTNKDPDWAWLPDGVTVAVKPGTILSDQAKEIFAHFEYYSDGERSFVLYGDHVGQHFDPSDVENTDPQLLAKELWELGEDAMYKSTHYHPDFGKYTMDDGMLAVRLFSDVWCYRDPEDFEDPLDYDHTPTFEIAIQMREELLSACARGRVLLAAFHPEE